jgi:hypothetical protein
MNHGHAITPVRGHTFDSRIAEALAHETGKPLELATRVYREELDDLAREARITQYLHVIAGRRARQRLRRH